MDSLVMKAVIVQGVADIVEVGMLFSLPIVDHRLVDIVAEGYDHRVEVSFDGTEFVQSSVVVQTQEHDHVWPIYVSESLMRATDTHNDTAMLASDSEYVFSFILVNIPPFWNHSEHFCYRVISQRVKTDQTPLDTVGIQANQSKPPNTFSRRWQATTRSKCASQLRSALSVMFLVMLATALIEINRPLVPFLSTWFTWNVIC